MEILTAFLQKIFGKLDDAEKVAAMAITEDSNKVIDDVIASLAALLAEGKREQFEEQAKDNASTLTVSDLPYLRKKFHNCPPIPSSVNRSEFMLGTWMALCQHACFELIYNLGIPAKDFLREIAFGPYDWTQANALNTLCRLYVDGKLGKDTIDEISKELPSMRHEARLYFAQDLLRFREHDERFEQVISELNSAAFNKAMQEVIDIKNQKDHSEE